MPQQMAWGGSICNYCCKICLSLTLYKERLFNFFSFIFFFFPPRGSKLSVLQMQIWAFQGNRIVEMHVVCADAKMFRLPL